MRVVASLATIPGREESLRKAVHSLLPQVDALHVHFNRHRAVDARRRMEAIVNDTYLGTPEGAVRGADVVVSYSGGSARGDKMKFLGLPGYTTPVCRLICDDDIIYPHNYAFVMCMEAQRLGGVISAHGAILRKPFTDYYRSRQSFHCTGKTEETKVDVLGTGVMAYIAGRDVRPHDCRFSLRNMADIWMAIYCKQRQIPMTVIAHDAGWIQLADPGNEETIWHHSARKTGSRMDTGDVQTRVIVENRALFNL